jgi:dipeptidyl aminopeptidase/acylaminoacyl peptidase
MRSVLALVFGLYATLLWTDHPFRRTVRVPARDGPHLAGNYYTSGNSGPGILLFHQCTRDRLIWDELATSLASSGNQVLVLNPRGVGDSEGAQWDYDGNLDHALEYWRQHWSDDAESAYQWLTSRPGIERDNIIAMGAGCGSFMAMVMAEVNKIRCRSPPLKRSICCRRIRQTGCCSTRNKLTALASSKNIRN